MDAEYLLDAMLYRGPAVSRPAFNAEVARAEARVTEAWREWAAALDLLLFPCDGTCGRDPYRSSFGEALRALRARHRR